ncbi:O-succinylbenzoic acid--CoA ligase [Flavobacteriaceae bacterium MAR_2010_188]|nr:O-succinylbenzoic acid--CoA ligase [Flavobacteriaceae bacterium MAR_2010_188]
MTPSFDKIHLKFKLNGFHYDTEQLKDAAYSFVKEGDPYEKSIGDFLLDWMDSNETIKLYTSGSTGPKKAIQISKLSMVNSAIATGDHFKITPGDTALLCLPVDYIAGKMMLVRAMILGLEIEIIEPEALVVFDYEKKYDFCAMVPLQLRKSQDRIQNIKTLIVGGASITSDVKKAVQNLETCIFETYGMTETVSHIAVKQINGEAKSKYFTLLPGITISQDDRNCLVIDAPDLRDEKIITNDIVEIHSPTEFQIVGRFDNMINSGGVNLFPEQIESKLQKRIDQRFIISSLEDEELGDKLILVVEGKPGCIDESVFEKLSKFETPREIFYVDKFVETKSRKIQRAQTLAKI